MTKKSKTIGYVLSGGGAKGLAHAGAIKFLEEQGVYPTHISGTSAGSIVASLYAWGKTPEQILDFFKSIYFFQWQHFTLKKPGIIDSDSFKKYFYDVFQEATLNDLKIPIHITATDMVDGKLMVFPKKTKITDAVLASSAFPGVLTPYTIADKVYSDGGILNHFPTDLLKRKCDYIIGIYVSPINTITAKELNSIRAVTTRAFDLLSANSNLQKFKNCNWVIEPKELCHYSTFETNKTKMEDIYKIGYEAAKESFQQLTDKF